MPPEQHPTPPAFGPADRHRPGRSAFCQRLLLVFWLLFSGGCALLDPVGGQPRSFRALWDRDARDLEAGYHAFGRGDLAGAHFLFEALLGKPDLHPDLALAAAYALVCTRLAQARSPDDFQAALALWRDWVARKAPLPLGDADPRMLAPFIEALPPLPSAPPPPPPPEPPPAEGCLAATGTLHKALDESRLNAGRLEREIRTLRSTLGRKELQIRAFEEQIRQFEDQIRGITDQIEALEEIDQRMEQKKKGISQP
jgi:hypothetical protein